MKRVQSKEPQKEEKLSRKTIKNNQELYANFSSIKGRKIVGYINSHKLKREGKGHNTGSIKPLYFFKQARQNETAIKDAIMQSINNALRKLSK